MPLTDAHLLTIRNHICRRGPTRVVVETENGHVKYAIAPGRAKYETQIEPDWVFIRDDGWSLGARRQDAAAAAKLWTESWIAIIDMHDTSDDGGKPHVQRLL